MINKDETIALGSDHYGMSLKNFVRDYLTEMGYKVEDLGVNSDEPVDYPDLGVIVAEAVAAGKYKNGILVCGTGAGMAIVANKVPRVRAVCISDPYTAERARSSNNANIITMGSQVLGFEVAKKLINIWLESEFQESRSLNKVKKIDLLDLKYRRL